MLGRETDQRLRMTADQTKDGDEAMQRIHTLWLWGFALIATAATGCVDDGPNNVGAFSAQWTVRNASGIPIPCSDVLAERVWFEMRPTTGNTAQKYDVEVACSQGGVTSPALPNGLYMANVHLLGPGNFELLQPLIFDQPVEINGRVNRLPELDFVMPTAAVGGPRMGLDWTLQYVGATTPITCADVGGATVEVTTAPAGGPAVTDVFPCLQMSGVTRPFAPGLYNVSVALKSTDGRVIAGTDAETIPVFPIGTDYGIVPFEVQSLVSSWAVTKAGAASTCAAVGATTVQLVAQMAPAPGQAPPAALTFQFDCNAMTGVTQAVNVGTYAITLSLLNAAGTAVVPPQSIPTFAATATQRAVLPPVVFAVP